MSTPESPWPIGQDPPEPNDVGPPDEEKVHDMGEMTLAEWAAYVDGLLEATHEP
jgi:hypothetical protein